MRQCFAGDGQNLPYNQCEEDTLVDYGCNSWFIKADWLVHFWQLRPFTKATGEDMHLSASLKLSAGIMTLVPKQNKETLCGNLKRFYGFDDKASWKAKDFISKRKAILQYLIDDCGWRPKLW